MDNIATVGFSIVKKVSAPRFDPEKLSIYTLSIQIGIVDMQVCVMNRQTSRCLLLEDYRFENVRTVKDRLSAVQQIFSKHKYLSSQEWGTVKLSLKTHKFSLVPAAYFISENSSDYLTLNADLNPKIEDIFYYRHISTDAVNLFAVDRKLVNFVREHFVKKQVQILSQASAFIEGTLQHDDHTNEKTMFCLVDKGILHVLVSQNQKLTYYNQFAVRKNEDYLKYIMQVFQDGKLKPKTSRVIIWGGVRPNSQVIELLKKYIKNISLGSKPGYLKFDEELHELPDQQYFDAYSIFLCE